VSLTREQMRAVLEQKAPFKPSAQAAAPFLRAQVSPGRSVSPPPGRPAAATPSPSPAAAASPSSAAAAESSGANTAAQKKHFRRSSLGDISELHPQLNAAGVSTGAPPSSSPLGGSSTLSNLLGSKKPPPAPPAVSPRGGGGVDLQLTAQANRAKSKKDVAACMKCGTKFGVTTWRYRCASCGGVYCSKCSKKLSVPKLDPKKPVEICIPCSTIY